MFDPDLQGHVGIRQRLLERADSGRIRGSLLFTGPDAVGKRRVAMELAQRELCVQRNACGRCEGCRLLKQEPLPTELPNLLRIAPEGKAGLIRIGAIRGDELVEGGVIQWAHHASMPGCHRWILIEDAHRLGGTSANMLLKTLEEPPPGTHFLLVTHRPEAMLPTIRSRCERIPFSALDADDLWRVARAAGWEEKDQAHWTALAAGTLRYLDPAIYHRAFQQVDAWISLAKGAELTTAIEALLPEKQVATAQSEQLAQTLELLLQVLGDIARLRGGLEPRLLPWRTELLTLAKSGLALKPPQEAVYAALRNLSRNPAAESLLRFLVQALR